MPPGYDAPPKATSLRAANVRSPEAGLFTLKLILDNGVEEYILQPDAEGLKSLPKIYKTSKHTTFDLSRNLLIFLILKIS